MDVFPWRVWLKAMVVAVTEPVQDGFGMQVAERFFHAALPAGRQGVEIQAAA